MRVTKAVITAAGHGTRQYPATATIQKEMIPLVDRDGICKPTIQIIVEEALDSGIEEICIVVAPGGEAAFREHFRELSEDERPAYEGKELALRQSERLGRMRGAISYAVQETQEGYGHAVYCARKFVGDAPFLLMLGDHVYITDEERRCARQLLDVFEEHGCPVSGVQPTPAAELHLFGAIGGTPVQGSPGVYEARAIYEKPTPEHAREHLRTPGLPEETYLCHFGMHAFTSMIFECLEEHIRGNLREHGEFQLTSAEELLRSRERYLAAELRGSRHDMGNPEGLVETQVALAMRGPFAERVREGIGRP
jgi:UTP--glucose-1-phosphate uridylyltransferase